jgi:amino acid adenylation domain-containing protein
VVFGSVRRVQGSEEGSPVGLHINTLPMRVQVTGSTILAELLRQVRDQHVASRPYKQTPLVEIRRCSKIPGPTALFDTFVVFNRESLGRILQSQGGNWSRREFRLAESLSSLPLGLYAYADPCLQLKLIYDSSRFDGAAAARILEHVACVLAAMTDRVHDAATNVPMLAAAETRLLAEWNDTRRDDLDPVCIHEIIEQRVCLSPDAVALTSSAGEVTYAELDRWADALACTLQRIGVGPEVLVAVYLPRSLEMVVSVLATLKAGGAYLPLDPDYPKARLAYMLQDARVKVVLTEERLAGDLPEGVPHVMHVQRGATGGTQARDVRPEGGVSPTHLAYVIYTSGSTGNPKGVMVEHRNVVNFFRAMDERVACASGGVWLAVTSLSFDISVLEFLWTLTRGFTVVVYPGGGVDRGADGRTEDVFRLGDYLRRYQITHMQCTPSMALMMTMDDACRSGMRTLQYLLIGGEPFPADLAAELRNLTTAEIINMYGPTETTIWSATFPVSSVDPGDPERGSVVPIGWPVMNTTFHVLDRHLQRVPPGVAGELFIGGDGVARGYLNLASLTRERFLPDPYDRHDHARLYRTGDLVRHGIDGCLRFLGRIDDQIKLQGYRIEPGEIEHHIQRHPGIDQAAVVAHDSALGDKHLRAYLVPTKGAPPSAKELRDYLGGLLPDYMIPGEFVFLERLPLTPNKKLDRKALAALRPSPAAFGERQSPAREGLESELAGVWEQVLGLRTIGRDDNFFDLGGDSFRAMKLHFKLRTVLGRELSLTDIFRFPTVRLLSDHLGRQNATDVLVRSGIDRGRARRMRRGRRDDNRKESSS